MERRMSHETGQPGAMGATSIPRSVSVSDAITLYEQKSRSSSTSMSRSSSRSAIYTNIVSSPSGSGNAVRAPSERPGKHPARSPPNTVVSILGDARPQLAEGSASNESRRMDVANDIGDANKIGIRGGPTIRPQRSASRPIVPKRVASNTSATTSTSRTPPASPRNYPGRSASNISSSSSQAPLAKGSAPNKPIGIGIGVPSTVRNRDARRASDTASIRPRSPRASYIAPNRQPFPHSISAPRSLSSQSYGVEHDDFSPHSERSQSPFHLQPAISVSQAISEKLLPPLYMRSPRSNLPRRTDGISIPLSRHTSISSTPSAYYTPSSSKSPMLSALEQKGEDADKNSILDGYFCNSFRSPFGPGPIKSATRLEQTRSDPPIAPDMDRRSSAMELYRRRDSSGSIASQESSEPLPSLGAPLGGPITVASPQRIPSAPALHHRASSTSSLNVGTMASDLELTQPLSSTTLTESQQLQPKPPRKSPRKPSPPKLGITPPNPISLLSTPNPSGPATPAATPPIPLKSPLRSISGGSSVTSYNSYSSVEIPGEISIETGIGLGFEGKQGPEEEGKVEKVRKVKKLASTDSIIANVGTPLTSQTRMARLLSATADDHTSQSPSRKDVDALKKRGDTRFTMLTAPSVYSQDSAPSSATSSAGLTDSPTGSTSTAGKAGSGNASESTKGSGKKMPMSGVFTQMAVGWGKMKEEREKRKSVDLGNIGHRRSSSLPRPKLVLPDEGFLASSIITESPDTAHTNASNTTVASNFSTRPTLGHTPLSSVPPPSFGARPADRSHGKSPSLPILRHYPTSPTSTDPTFKGNFIPPSSPRRAETSTALSSLLSPSSTASIATSGVSKRSHLLREIATSERAYATDLKLVRDAYMYSHLQQFREGSLSSVSSSASVSTSGSDKSKRRSMYASHKQSLSVSQTSSTQREGLPKSPSEGMNLTLQAAPIVGAMSPPVGKPLSPADVKAVFLNLDQLVAVAEELATKFEEAVGEDEEEGRDCEGGSDRMGEVFVSMVPKLQPLYSYFCARQSSASRHLLTLQSNPSHFTYLSQRWSSISTQTRAWNLDSMLIKPVQRITKYPLLFEDLLKMTTPVHADYFKIREAKEMARGMAVEIDEGKRRKEAVENAIGKKKVMAQPTAKDTKNIVSKAQGSKLLGLKRFRKDKPRTPSSSTPDLVSPQQISQSSFNQLSELSARLTALDEGVKKIGQDIMMWTAAAKETLVAQDELVKAWLHVVQLEPTDPTDQRMLEIRRVIDGVVSEAWGGLSIEVKDLIMPILSNLLNSTSNPRKVLSKRSSKHPDYTRYHAFRISKRTPDRDTVQGALEFVALHEQLIEELPAFLEGCLRILDIAVVGFARAQAKYFRMTRDRLRAFAEGWIQSPLGAGLATGESNGESSAIAGADIVKAWQECWEPYAEAMDKFECTKASFKPAQLKHRDPVYRGDLHPPGLRHSASTTSAFSPLSSRPESPTFSIPTRVRSSSLRDSFTTAPTIITPHTSSSTFASYSNQALSKDSQGTGRFNLLRRSSSKNNSNAPSRPPSRPTHSRRGSGLRPASFTSDSSRLSWGLPQIPAAGEGTMFDGLGISPTDSLSLTSATSPTSASNRTEEMAERSPYLGASAPEFSSLRVSPHAPNSAFTGKMPMPKHPFAVSPVSETCSRSGSRADSRRMRAVEIDVAEGWRNEKVIYQCACVADFEPVELGNKKYRGLWFLPMVVGDLIDVFHEVGRIEELPSFPYPEVGVENDGILVGRAENGEIGLVICSFLEPLR
ncbi:hypothetical protein J002_06242 [Cryptococcus neoformans]|nr:hypothetical protein J004_06242 [Cryptococcus neoformans var. grubii]OXH45512.1 hypothetical protein J002_06242 [Cryptococcus neoformans var. grubii]OXH64521.1 hypothetical protein J000_06241 [Cryptococcus neoformans var. grubii]